MIGSQFPTVPISSRNRSSRFPNPIGGTRTGTDRVWSSAGTVFRSRSDLFSLEGARSAPLEILSVRKTPNAPTSPTKPRQAREPGALALDVDADERHVEPAERVSARKLDARRARIVSARSLEARSHRDSRRDSHRRDRVPPLPADLVADDSDSESSAKNGNPGSESTISNTSKRRRRDSNPHRTRKEVLWENALPSPPIPTEPVHPQP